MAGATREPPLPAQAGRAGDAEDRRVPLSRRTAARRAMSHGPARSEEFDGHAQQDRYHAGRQGRRGGTACWQHHRRRCCRRIKDACVHHPSTVEPREPINNLAVRGRMSRWPRASLPASRHLLLPDDARLRYPRPGSPGGERGARPPGASLCPAVEQVDAAAAFSARRRLRHEGRGRSRGARAAHTLSMNSGKRADGERPPAAPARGCGDQQAHRPLRRHHPVSTGAAARMKRGRWRTESGGAGGQGRFPYSVSSRMATMRPHLPPRRRPRLGGPAP